MIENCGDGSLAIAGGILDLFADLSERAILKNHHRRGQQPMRAARDASRIEVVGAMASAAAKGGCAVPLGAAHDRWLMRLHAVGLPWLVTIDVTVHAARMPEHLAGFLEQSDRARTRVGD